MWQRLKQASSGLVDALFPPRCVGCGREGDFLCPRCVASAQRMLEPYCLLCARRVLAPGLCASCQAGKGHLEGIFSPFIMQGVVREAVHRLKYGNLRSLAPTLGGLLADYAGPRLDGVDTLVPVSLHPRRVRERGYNQAELLAREVGRRLDVPVDTKALVRVRHSPPQAGSSSREARLANVSGAFRARGVESGSRLVVVDDVCTTGATLEACAQALRDAGASAVWGITLAREV